MTIKSNAIFQYLRTNALAFGLSFLVNFLILAGIDSANGVINTLTKGASIVVITNVIIEYIRVIRETEPAQEEESQD